MTNWQTKRLGDVLEKIEGGGTPSKEKKEFWDGSIPWASVKDLTSFNPKETQDYITDEGLKNSSSRLVKAGTLITPTRMALGFTVRFDIDVAINQDLKALYPIDDMSTEFIQYWFEAYRKTIERLGTGSTVAGIQVGELRALKIQAPEKPEQERIVGVLEVWDEYIEKLEQKIALKEQLKKGLMQQLLTGKQRLPGFSDGWQMTTVGSLGRIVSGGTPDTSKSEYWGGEIDWITPTEITKIKRLINKPTKKRITNAGLRASSTFVLPPISLVQCSRATIGECAINETEITTNQGFKNIIPNRKVDVWYLYYWIKQNKKLLLRISSGSTFLEYSKKDLERLKINLPGLDEQLCVARVLKNIDKQIENYEAKKILIESQKKYLLKNLITGTIRTPEDLQPLDSSRLESSAL